MTMGSPCRNASQRMRALANPVAIQKMESAAIHRRCCDAIRHAVNEEARGASRAIKQSVWYVWSNASLLILRFHRVQMFENDGKH